MVITMKYLLFNHVNVNFLRKLMNQESFCGISVVESFLDGNSALILVCARLRHVTDTQWGNKKYINMKHLETALEDVSIAG